VPFQILPFFESALCGFISRNGVASIVLQPHHNHDTIFAVEGLQFSKIDVMLIASRELVEDMRMGTAIGPRIR
jgi:type III secretory pathway component EscT